MKRTGEADLQSAVGHLELPLFIVQEVCKSFSVSPVTLCSRDRHGKVAMARQTAYWLCMRLGMGQSEVAKLFKRDHGAVAHGVNAIEAGRATNEKFRERIDKLLDECRQNPGESAGRTSYPGSGVAARGL